MKKVELYTTSTCPYCVRAKMLLQQKNIPYEEIDASPQEVRMALLEKSGGRRTVPQIFIDDQPIGGFDDLKKLDDDGKLDAMVSN